ncbi:MAG: four helix bundle protein [Candidatus Mcinerneyibacterium aminivorans]|uniref:Four helix bundle protein n=2 Tax=Candidatus Mcinerneyibacterium aminivorans TaxID=2703815 RepID=A0A5D0MHD2_9BACT|nr:MAG: four helix bundle protein [Candidatus Mcinerneyibacterium aminivorans]
MKKYYYDKGVGIKNHKDLLAWKKAMKLSKYVYKITKKFPKVKQYRMISQLRRAVVSIPSNIAEKAARSSEKEFLQFLHVSLGSVAEVETQLLLSKEFGYINEIKMNKLGEVRRLILGLIKSIKIEN